MSTLAELWSNMLESTAQGFVGVPMIYIFFVVIVVAAIWRIRRGEHLDH